MNKFTYLLLEQKVGTSATRSDVSLGTKKDVVPTKHGLMGLGKCGANKQQRLLKKTVQIRSPRRATKNRNSDTNGFLLVKMLPAVQYGLITRNILYAFIATHWISSS